MTRLALPAVLAVLSCACASAPPARTGEAKAAGPGATSGANAPKDGAPAPGEISPFSDAAYGFRVDFSGPFERGETQTQSGPQGTVSGYSTVWKSADRVQILNVQAVTFAGGEIPEKRGCKALLPILFKEMAVERLECGPVSNVRLLEHLPDGVYSITGDVARCAGIDEARTTIHAVCDQRKEGAIVATLLAAIGKEQEDPMNRWFLCSLLLRGDVITCPWRVKTAQELP